MQADQLYFSNHISVVSQYLITLHNAIDCVNTASERWILAWFLVMFAWESTCQHYSSCMMDCNVQSHPWGKNSKSWKLLYRLNQQLMHEYVIWATCEDALCPTSAQTWDCLQSLRVACQCCAWKWHICNLNFYRLDICMQWLNGTSQWRISTEVKLINSW